jgi:cytochrome c oxidase subunit 3
LINLAGDKNAAATETKADEDVTITIQKSDVERYGYLLPAYGTYYAIYFLVTGLHALHIVGGVVVMTYFLTIGSRMYKRNPEQLSNRIEVTGIFWHFVDLVWITVFPILYLT